VALYEHYQNQLDGFVFQAPTAKRQAHQFAPVLTPENVDPAAISEALTVAGIGHASYFRPHLSEQSYFQENSILLPIPVTDDASRRCLSLPMYEDMIQDEINYVCEVINTAI
jgi:dTDP-4-amino-4,6-dideoxygalactose transaminase